MASFNTTKAFAGSMLIEYDPHWFGSAVFESAIVAGVYFYAIVRLDGVAFRPLGVQSRAITVNGRSIVVPLTLAVAVRTALIVPA